MRLKDSTKVDPQELYQYLTKEKGLSHNHAVGMIANIRAESNFNSSAIGDGGNSGGLFQHNTNRFEALKEFSGGDWKNWRKQVDYALTESDTKKFVQQQFNTPEEASYWFTTKWERPSNKEQKAKERQRFAKEYDYDFLQTKQETIKQQEPIFIPQHSADKTYVEPITPAKLNKAIEEVQIIEQDLEESPELRAIEAKKKFIKMIDPLFDVDTFDFNEPKPQQQSQPTPFNIELKPLIDRLPILPRLFETQLNPKFEDGGTFSEDNPRDAMIKARLAYEYQRGNPAVLRMMSGHDSPYQFEDGSVGTHYMASMDNYAVPLIQDKNGSLVLGDYGPESKEAIQFDSPEDAEYFAENYKKFANAFKQ